MAEKGPKKFSRFMRHFPTTRMSVKNIELYKRVLEAEKKEDAVIEGSFKRINNQAFNISTKEQTKTLMTCTDNKRWILDDNVHTLAFGHYRLK